MAIFGRMQFNEVADVLKNTKPDKFHMRETMQQWRHMVLAFAEKFKMVNKSFDEKKFLKNCDFDDL